MNIVNDELWAELKGILGIHTFNIIHKTETQIDDEDLVKMVEAVRAHPHEVYVINYWYIDDEDNDSSISVHATLKGAQARAHHLCAEQYDEQIHPDSTALMVSRQNEDGHTVHEITTEDKTVLESWTVYPTTLEK